MLWRLFSFRKANIKETNVIEYIMTTPPCNYYLFVQQKYIYQLPRILTALLHVA